MLASVSFSSVSTVVLADDFYRQMTDEVNASIWANLAACSLAQVDALDPHLPRPRVPADTAVVNSEGTVLAYFKHSSGLFGCYADEFKNPDGSMKHHANVCFESVSFSTPKQGVVATVQTILTTAGRDYQYNCRQYPNIPRDQFQRCVKDLYIDVISQQLCRFGNYRGF